MFAKQPQRTTELIDEGSDACCEMKGANVFAEVVDESFSNVAHLADDLASHFGEANGGRSWNKAFAFADEEFGVEFVSEIVKLEANGAGREMNFFGGAGHAWRFHDGEKKLELVNIHERILLRECGAKAQLNRLAKMRAIEAHGILHCGCTVAASGRGAMEVSWTVLTSEEGK